MRAAFPSLPVPRKRPRSATCSFRRPRSVTFPRASPFVTRPAPVRHSNPMHPAPDYLTTRWEDAVASKLDPVDRLIYRSNLLGADARITNTGGGNTSAKITTSDPVTGEPCRVLWVKGSGGDLRTA